MLTPLQQAILKQGAAQRNLDHAKKTGKTTIIPELEQKLNNAIADVKKEENAERIMMGTQ